MWLSKEFFTGYFILICSPGRNPARHKEAEASFKIVVKEISVYQINLNSDITALASGKIHSPSLIPGRDISIRMVLLKIETEPGQWSGTTKCFRSRM
jgi:hypothetical protein